jgi:hypothetical protein
LAAPLAFFYLGWIAENGIKDGPWTNNNAPPLPVLRNFTTVFSPFHIFEIILFYY